MPFQFACPACRVVFGLPSNTPGAVIACPSCGSQMQLPQLSLPIAQPVSCAQVPPPLSPSCSADHPVGSAGPGFHGDQKPRMRNVRGILTSLVALGATGMIGLVLGFALNEVLRRGERPSKSVPAVARPEGGGLHEAGAIPVDRGEKKLVAGPLVPAGRLGQDRPAPVVPKRNKEQGRPAPAPAPVRAITERRLSRLGEQAERAIHEGVRFLQGQQFPDGSWSDAAIAGTTTPAPKSGLTSLATLALLAAGEKTESPTLRNALEFLRKFAPEGLDNTYAVALQTMVFADAEPEIDRTRVAANVRWLERAQFKPGDRTRWPGSWTYSARRSRPRGDASCTHYALLGLHAAREVGIPVDPEVWALARSYWESSQKPDGSWAYTPDSPASTASMTCAGVSSLLISGLRRDPGQEFLKDISGLRRDPGQEFLKDDAIKNCGKGGANPRLAIGINWLAGNFQVGENYGGGQQWKFYYLHNLERAGRLAGIRYFGPHDWYRLGAEELVHTQDKVNGSWQGALIEHDPIVSTSFALLFLTTGRAPILINKLRHLPAGDWDNDPDDIGNLVHVVSRDRKSPVRWQVVDSQGATVADLLRAPIVFFNGHKAPQFTAAEMKNLREYVERGGFILAEACCGSGEFDQSFRGLMKEIFPEREHELRPLPDDHPVWKDKHRIAPRDYPLLGIRRGDRTPVIYSRHDLSCYWNQSERDPANPEVIKAIQVGQNVIDYATAGRILPDELSAP